MIVITKEGFSEDEVISGVRRGDMGCIVTFQGIVRDNANGKPVKRIEIQVYENMALKQLESIRAEALGKYEIHEVAIVHRYGSLDVGERIMMIAVGAAHRKDAFKACSYIIDSIKERVPIWKKEYTPEGEFWVEGEVSER